MKLTIEERAKLQEDIALARSGTKFTTKAVLHWLERLSQIDTPTSQEADSQVFFIKGGRL